MSTAFRHRTAKDAVQVPNSDVEEEANQAAEHRLEVAAAKLRVVLDRRLGRETPDSVQSLAAEDY